MLVTESRPGQNRHVGGSSASACNSQGIADSCVRGHTASDPPRFFYGPAGNFSQPTHIELQIYARWRAAGRRRLCAAYQKNASSSLLPPYPGIIEKPGEVESREKNPRCMRLGTLFRSPAITKETARSCRLQRGRNGLNTTMQGGPLTSSAVHHIIKIPARASLAMAQNSLIRGSIKNQNSLLITPWLSFF